MPNAPSWRRRVLALRGHFRILIDPADEGWRAHLVYQSGRTHRASPTAYGHTEAAALRALVCTLREIDEVIQAAYRFDGQETAGDPCPSCGDEGPVISIGRDGALGNFRCPACNTELENKAPIEPLERYDPKKHGGG